MNTSKKGYRKELLCRKQLEKAGWAILFKSIRTKWGTIDFGNGLFDTVAVKIIDDHPEWLFISNKHKTHGNTHLQHQEAIRQFKALKSLSFMRFELWLWCAPRWSGRNPNKVWNGARWEVITI